jgi:hypothetical protein
MVKRPTGVLGFFENPNGKKAHRGIRVFENPNGKKKHYDPMTL